MNRHRRRAQAKLGRTAIAVHGKLAPDKISPASAELLQLGLDQYKGGALPKRKRVTGECWSTDPTIYARVTIARR